MLLSVPMLVSRARVWNYISTYGVKQSDHALTQTVTYKHLTQLLIKPLYSFLFQRLRTQKTDDHGHSTAPKLGSWTGILIVSKQKLPFMSAWLSRHAIRDTKDFVQKLWRNLRLALQLQVRGEVSLRCGG